MLSQLADIADVLAALGVIGSVLFLAYELHQQNRETGLNNWRQLLESLTRYKGLMHDPALADLVIRGNSDYDGLTPAEKLSYGMYLEQGIHIIGNFQKHGGTVPKQLKGLDLAVDNLLLDLLGSPGARQWWVETKPRGRFMPVTAENIERIQKEGRKPVGPHLGQLAAGQEQ